MRKEERIMYKWNFFEDGYLADCLSCIRCKKIPSPEIMIYHENCHKTICIYCLKKMQKKKTSKCLDCNQEFENTIIKECNPDFYKIVTNLNMICPQRLCTWKGTFSEIDNHLKTCTKYKKACKYWSIGCNFHGFPDSHINHKKVEMKKHCELMKKVLETGSLKKDIRNFKDESEKKEFFQYIEKKQEKYLKIIDKIDHSNQCGPKLEKSPTKQCKCLIHSFSYAFQRFSIQVQRERELQN